MIIMDVSAITGGDRKCLDGGWKGTGLDFPDRQGACAMTGTGYVTARCYCCERLFSSNPLTTPTHKNQPICKSCIEEINRMRAAKGYPLFMVPANTFDPAEAETIPDPVKATPTSSGAGHLPRRPGLDLLGAPVENWAMAAQRLPQTQYVGFAGVLALIICVFLVAHFAGSFNGHLRSPSSATGGAQSGAPRVSQVRVPFMPDPAVQMRRAVSVQIVSKGTREWDYTGGTRAITFKARMANRSGKEMRGFRGDIVFYDLFGDKIYTIHVKYDEGLKAGATVVWPGEIDYYEYDAASQKLRDTVLKNMRVEWVPQTILFADGTKLGE